MRCGLVESCSLLLWNLAGRFLCTLATLAAGGASLWAGYKQHGGGFEAVMACCARRKPRNITRPNGDPSANPHPDASGGKVAGVAEVLLTLQYTRTGLSGPTYKVIQYLLDSPHALSALRPSHQRQPHALVVRIAGLAERAQPAEPCLRARCRRWARRRSCPTTARP